MNKILYIEKNIPQKNEKNLKYVFLYYYLLIVVGI